MKKFTVYRLSLFLLLLSVMTGCNRKVGPTRVMVTDPVRHYNPINLGDELEIYYDVINIGESPLIITDVQPSCSCITVNQNKRIVIYPEKKLTMHFTFKATKNIGYVHHTIRLYCNVEPQGMLPLEFDLNVVPPSGVTPDYEEYFSEAIRYARLNGFSIKETVDGDLTERDYVTDSLSMAQWIKKYQ